MAVFQGLFCFVVVSAFVNKELGNSKVYAFFFPSFLTYNEKAFFHVMNRHLVIITFF